MFFLDPSTLNAWDVEGRAFRLYSSSQSLSGIRAPAAQTVSPRPCAWKTTQTCSTAANTNQSTDTKKLEKYFACPCNHCPQSALIPRLPIEIALPKNQGSVQSETAPSDVPGLGGDFLDSGMAELALLAALDKCGFPVTEAGKTTPLRR
mmetsp:Transcript_5557/g.15944  ORF Transcript_5557/g.15944 Transcript_5557/m.15944 type:complete len:149 (-) Transcript_5557:292-738(-)